MDEVKICIVRVAIAIGIIRFLNGQIDNSIDVPSGCRRRGVNDKDVRRVLWARRSYDACIRRVRLSESRERGISRD